MQSAEKRSQLAMNINVDPELSEWSQRSGPNSKLGAQDQLTTDRVMKLIRSPACACERSQHCNGFNFEFDDVAIEQDSERIRRRIESRDDHRTAVV